MTTPENLAKLSALPAFDFQSHTRIVFGVNTIERVGELARDLAAKRVLLVTDAGLVAAGHADHVKEILQNSGLNVSVFAEVIQNPTTACVDQCTAMAREEKIDTIVGLGGGSAMDTAKGCNFLLTNGGEMRDYWGTGKATRPMLPLIAIPTTAGTGSECQSYAIIVDIKTHQKMACGDPKALPRVAILDPAVTASQPLRVTAATGVDAIAHALESAVTRKRTPLSLMFSREAFRLTFNNLPCVLKEPENLGARGKMLLGAAFAGTAIENSMLGAAHSAANPLTAHYEIVHGQAVGIMLPPVVCFNAEDPASKEIYAELATLAGLFPTTACFSIRDFCQSLETILDQAQFPQSLEECGVDAKKIPDLAREAAAQWTARFNPRAISELDFEELYQTAFKPRGKSGSGTF